MLNLFLELNLIQKPGICFDKKSHVVTLNIKVTLCLKMSDSESTLKCLSDFEAIFVNLPKNVLNSDNLVKKIENNQSIRARPRYL